MRSKVAIAGHPLHPMLVPLPIGLLFGAVVADFAYLLTDKDTMWYDIAFWALIGGVVTALIAAVAGFAEFWLMARHMDGREMAIAHMVMNLTVVALFTVSIILRLNNNALDGASFGAAFALSLVGIVV